MSGSLHVHGISVDIAGHRIVDDITLTASSNVVGLVGPNGSGKSTLLRTVYRVLRPAEGRVTASGIDVWKSPAREAARITAAVVQDSPIDLELTVQDCVSTGRLPHGTLFATGRADDRRIVEDAMHQAGVYALATRNVSTLSGGERQRVHLARALAQQPQVLILDEPTNHLDIRHQLQLLTLIRELAVTTLVTLHDLNLAAAYCDQIVLLDAGRVVAHGTPREVFTPRNLDDVFDVCATPVENPLTGQLQLMYANPHSSADARRARTPSEGSSHD